MDSSKQLLILNRDLTIKKILSIDKVIPVQDIISPQKTTFEIPKNKEIVIGDLLVLKRENEVEYIGIIQDLETNKTTKLASYPLISIADTDCIMGSINGSVFNWIKEIFEYNFVKTLTDGSTDDYVDNLLHLPFSFVDNTMGKTLKLEVSNGNLFDVLIDIFKKTGVYLKFNLTYSQGKVNNIVVSVNIASEETKIFLRYDNPLIVEQPVIENSQNQDVNKVIFIPNDDNTKADAKNVYVFYLLDNNTVTNNPKGTDTGKRISGVKQTIQEYSDDDYTAGLQVKAEEIMVGNTLDHQITIKILQNKGFDVQLYDKVAYIDTDRIYDTYVTRIENFNNVYKIIRLGVLRTTLTDKIKNLEKLLNKKTFGTQVISGGSSSGGESYDDTEIRQSIADLETNVSKKLDRIDGSTSTALYGVGSSGQQVMFSVAQGTGTNTIVRRNGQQIKVPLTPSANDDATSKFYVDNLVSTIPKFSVEVVTSLPTENISTTTVYLVSSGSEEQNLYSEYIYVQDKENPELFKWEKLGEQRIDLSNYTTKEELAQAIAESLIDYYTSEQVDDLIENAKTKYKKVVSLPTSTEIEDNTIYLLQHTTDTGIYYTEHIYTNGSWEQFGSNADVDIVGILDNTKKIAISTGGFSAGSSSNVTGTGGAIGKSSQVSKGGAIGENATTSLGFAGGYNAKTIKTLADGISTSPSDAIQLGTGTNKKEKSLQVYDDNIYDAETHTLTVQNIELDGEDINDKIAQSSSSFMPIGSIFASAIPQEDARVHLLDGSVIQQDGVYADFVNLVKSLVSAGYNITCLESEYEEDIRKTGNCGRFIINSDSIRLPTITTFIQGLSDLTSLTDIGSKVEAGLPNIKASYSAFMRDDGINESVTGAFSVSKPRERSWNGASGDGVRALSFNANKYNSIYSDSVNTVQPPATRYPYYIVLASGYKSTQQVNVDNIMTEVNGKLAKAEIKRYPIEIYTSSSTWAVIYDNGDRECGGIISLSQTVTSSGEYNYTLALPIEFEGNYSVVYNGSNYVIPLGSYQHAKQSCVLRFGGYQGSRTLTRIDWHAKGR